MKSNGRKCHVRRFVAQLLHKPHERSNREHGRTDHEIWSLHCLISVLIDGYLNRIVTAVAYLIHNVESRKVAPLRTEEKTRTLLLHHEHMTMAIGSCS